MTIDSKRYTDYQILKSIEQNSELSQRLMSKQTGINLASINYALKRLIQKGYVKITTMNKKRILYHLTSAGITQKGRLAYDFFLHNYKLFSEVGDLITLNLSQIDLKNKRVAIFGLNELTEIIYLCLIKNGIEFGGLYEDDESVIGKVWLEATVLSLDSLKDIREKTLYLLDIKSGREDVLNFEILSHEELFKKKSLKNDNTNNI